MTKNGDGGCASAKDDAVASINKRELATSDTEIRGRIHETMTSIFDGQRHMLPVLIVLLFQYIAGTDTENVPQNAQDAILGVLERGVGALSILSDVAQEVECKQIEAQRKERARESLRTELGSVLVKANLFALGMAMSVAQARGIVMWCVSIFLVYEMYEIFGDYVNSWMSRDPHPPTVPLAAARALLYSIILQDAFF